MDLSVQYYPEWVPEKRWEEDLRLMSEAGIRLVRVGEFAWCRMEKESGKFDLDWLDNFLKILARYKMQAVLCTPTNSPPPWLVKEHPDILPVHANRSRRLLGSRRHYCPNNPAYQEHSREIARALGRRFHGLPAVFAWQLDNEFAGEATGCCYCDTCKKKFQGWLKEKYRSLAELNRRWGTIFWSQEYTEWDQIELPLNPIDPNFSLETVPWFRNRYLISKGLAAIRTLNMKRFR